ncbi:MAG: dethiobiotin synthase [Kofleriaceae bacterium]
MKQGYFITGTGTEVGKTFLTASLARRARERGLRVFAFKPIETGCRNQGDALIGADQQVLVTAAGDWQHGPLCGAYQFEPPVAPSVAAARASVTISLDHAVALPRAAMLGQPPFEHVDLVLVEGAGGWRVPITPTHDMSSLAAASGLPVLVAALATLGTLNHTLLTVEAIERDGQRCAGVVLSQRPEDDQSLVQSNLAELRARWDGPILALTTDRSVLDPFLNFAVA